MKSTRLAFSTVLTALLLSSAVTCAAASGAPTIKVNNEDAAQTSSHGGGFLLLTKSKGHVIGRIKASTARKLKHPLLSAHCYQPLDDNDRSTTQQPGVRRADGSVVLPQFRYFDRGTGVWCVWRLTSLYKVKAHTRRVNNGYEIATVKGSTRRVDEINTINTMQNVYFAQFANEISRQLNTLGIDDGEEIDPSQETSRPVVRLSGPDDLPPAGGYGNWVNPTVTQKAKSPSSQQGKITTTEGSYTKVGPDPSGTGFLWIRFDKSTKVTSTNVAGALQDLNTVQHLVYGGYPF